MPQLRKQVKSSLLKNGPHLNEPAPQPQAEVMYEVEDYERDPESSDDSDDGRSADIPTWNPIPSVPQEVKLRRTGLSKTKAAPRRAADPLVRKRTVGTRASRGSTAASTGNKRTWEGDKVESSDFSDIDDSELVDKPVPVPAKTKISSNEDALENMLFSSQQGASQQKTYGSQGSTSNIHAGPSKTTAPIKNNRKDHKPAKLAFKMPPGFDKLSVPPSGPAAFITPNLESTTLRETDRNTAVFRLPPRTPPRSAKPNDPTCPSSPLTIFTPDLSSPPLSPALGENDLLTSPSSPPSSMTSKTIECPLCRTVVGRTLYDEFLADLGRTRMRVRDKLRFCNLHNATTAKDNWDRSEYPTIDWKKLPARLEQLDSVVADILTRRIHSTYRKALQSAVADDNVNYRHAMRNPEAQVRVPIAKVVDNAALIPNSSTDPAPINIVSSQAEDEESSTFSSTGYYGPRGSRVILDHVMSSPLISQQLREVSANEELFKRVGIPYFLQVVIVPEIAWRLIRDDMGLGGDERMKKRRRGDTEPEEGEIRAKEILLESKKAGELVNGGDEEDVTEIAPPELDDDRVYLSG